MNRVLIVTPILFEENSPFNKILKDLLVGFLQQGFSITRIVAIEKKGDNSFTMGLSNIEYIKVLRHRVKKNNFIRRFLFDLLTSMKMSKLIKKDKYDILFEDVSFCSPIFVKIAKKRKIKVVSMFQDVWPDNAVNSGLLKKNSILYKLFSIMQNPVYRFSDECIFISDDMKNYLTSRIPSDTPCFTIYNWVDNVTHESIPFKKNEFAIKYNLPENTFYVVYAGNIGVMQNVDIIIRAAKKLESNKNIRFLIVGEGSKKKDICQKCKNLSNVSIFPFQSSLMTKHLYAMSNLNIVPLVNNGINTALPSKIPYCISNGKPTLFAIGKNCFFSSIVKEYGVGLCVDSNDEVELVNSILLFQSRKDYNPNLSILDEYFNKEKNIEKYIEALKK